MDQEFSIIDKQRRKIRASLLSEDNYFEISVHHNACYIGDIHFKLLDASRMDITTIEIFDPRPTRWDKIRCYFTRQQTAYTRNGIGSKLVELAIRIGKELGATHATGFISGPNLRTHPYLPQWWAKQGFEVTRTQDGSVTHLLYKDLTG